MIWSFMFDYEDAVLDEEEGVENEDVWAYRDYCEEREADQYEEEGYAYQLAQKEIDSDEDDFYYYDDYDDVDM